MPLPPLAWIPGHDVAITEGDVLHRVGCVAAIEREAQAERVWLPGPAE